MVDTDTMSNEETQIQDLVYALAASPRFAQDGVVFAARQSGLYRSDDGGVTWFKSSTGLLPTSRPNALSPTPESAEAFYLASGLPLSGLFRTTDGGDTWALLSDNEGFPTGTLGIIGIAVSPTNNKNLYAIVEAEDGGVFRSRDGGETWTRTNEHRNLRQRAWYYERTYADPADEDAVYVLNVRFHRSKDGGKTFEAIATPHGDNHDLWIDPGDPLRMIESNDGGGNVSYDGGETWSVNEPISPPFDPHLGWPQDDKLGDYYDMVSDELGVRIAYAATFNGEQDVYYLRIGPRDCNRNAVSDADDLAAATSPDCNRNEIPDECDLAADLSSDIDGNGVLKAADGEVGPVARKYYDAITGIQYGKTEDPMGWIEPVAQR